MSRELEDKPQTERKYLQKTHKGLLSKIYKKKKNLLKFNNKKANNSIKKIDHRP